MTKGNMEKGKMTNSNILQILDIRCYLIYLVASISKIC